MIHDGIEKYVENVTTKLYLLQVGERFLPLTVNETEYENSYLTSNYFPITHRNEQLKKEVSLSSRVMLGANQVAGAFLRGIQINKCVIVNNLFLSTNLYMPLSSEELEAVTSFLVERFPSHMVMFRNLGEEDLSQFQTLKYSLLKSRETFCYDPKWNFSSRVHYHHRRDLRLIEKHGYEVVRSFDSKDYGAMLALYEQVYLKKHTQYSPRYTEVFIDKAISSGLLQFVALRREGVIEGVFGMHVNGKKMCVPFFGYEMESERSGHLYRLLTVLAIKEAEARGLFLNDGTGGAEAKMKRGMQLVPEYVAIYARHLSAVRRSFWAFADFFTTTPTIKR